MTDDQQQGGGALPFWQPIATAPTDREVLVLSGRTVWTATQLAEGTDMPSAWFGTAGGTPYFADDSGAGPYPRQELWPSAWAPLPPADALTGAQDTAAAAAVWAPGADPLRRLGFFSVSLGLIRADPGAVARLLAGVIVIRAEMMLAADAVHYTAASAAFDTVPEGEQWPTYAADITQTGDAPPDIRWHRVPHNWPSAISSGSRPTRPLSDLRACPATE